MEKKYKITIKYIIYFVVSIIAILILSKSTSPLYDGSFSGDSALFQIIGKGILNGYIPYVDLFDHKGPILFFIQALGILINENIGIFILQIINYFITIVFLDKLINLFEKGKIKKYIELTLTLIFYGLIFEEGNLTEEWSLGIILISFYIICKGILNNNFRKTDYLINGIIFALITLIRINNAATIIGFCIYEFFSLIACKNYKELKKLILYFLLGIAIVYIPIIIIFYKWNALYEMIYATFIFNFIYGTNSSAFSITAIILKILNIIPLLMLFIKIYKDDGYEKNFKRCFYTIIILNAICVSIGYGYVHYYIILIPLIAILLTQLNLNINLKNINKSANLIINVFVLLCYVEIMYSQIIQYNEGNNKVYVPTDEILELKDYIEDESSVLCYSSVSPRTYLVLNIMPCYKYFTYQEWHIYNNVNIYYEFVSYIKERKIRYIITAIDYESEILSEALEEYNLIYENENLSLWELN